MMLPWRLVSGKREMGLPIESTGSEATDRAVAVEFPDGTKMELANFTYGDLRKLELKRQRASGALFELEHEALHHRITVTQKPQKGRNLLLIAVEQKKPSARCW